MNEEATKKRAEVFSEIDKMIKSFKNRANTEKMFKDDETSKRDFFKVLNMAGEMIKIAIGEENTPTQRIACAFMEAIRIMDILLGGSKTNGDFLNKMKVAINLM